MSNLQHLRALAGPIYDEHHPDDSGLLPRIFLPVINMHPTPAQDAARPVGTSKLGGLPDLGPAGWPVTAGTPQFFVAQFNLAELQAHDEDRLLPTTGLLSFFMSEAAIGGHEGPEHYTVRHEPDLGVLRRAAPPYAGYEVHEYAPPAHQLAFQVGVHPFGSVLYWQAEDDSYRVVPDISGDPRWATLAEQGDVSEAPYLLGVSEVYVWNGAGRLDHEVTLLTLPDLSAVLPLVNAYNDVTYAFQIPREDLAVGDFSRVRLESSAS